MKKYYYFLFLFCLMALSVSVKAQSYEEVVYLHNGSIIHGIIIEQVPNKSVKIQTRDGNVFVYNMADIEKITKEPIMGNRRRSQHRNHNAYSDVTRKNPGAAFLWSFILPGGGQFYNGQTEKALVMLGLNITGWVCAISALNDYSYESSYYHDYDVWDGESLFYVSMFVLTANAVWSMIDAPLSANKINRNNGLSFKYKMNKNLDLALKPDCKMDAVAGKMAPVFGAKLSFNLH